MPKTVLRSTAALAGVVWLALGLSSRDAWQPWPLVALGAGLLVLSRWGAKGVERALLFLPPRVFTTIVAIASSGTSLWLVRGPMRNRPLAIDAAVYLMQARAMAHGHLGIPVSTPLLHASNRFLLEGSDGQLYGVFPEGYPLFLVPFVWTGLFMFSGPLLAALLVLATSWLARAMGANEMARRVALLAMALSFARAMETADLLSHAFVALMVTCALALLIMRRAPVLLGACIGLAIAARLLDGAVLAVACAAILPWHRDARAAVRAFLGAAPFLALLFVEQKAATGQWGALTQSVYFERSDWPPGCHALGFGKNIGCTVEHALWMPLMGGDGYGISDGIRVLRERGIAFGKDLFGAGILGALVFALAVRRPRRRDVLGAVFVCGFALAYGLFYFGNVPFYGARHLFPVAPLAWVLAGRSVANVWRRRAGMLAGATILAIVVGQIPIWRTQTSAISGYMHARHDLRADVEREGITQGIVYSSDITGVVSAFDPRADGNKLFIVQDDRSGLLDLRRTHPDLEVWKSLEDDHLAKLVINPPPPGILVELERAWPTFQRIHDLGARPAEVSYVKLPPTAASGRAALFVSHASPGSWLEVPFAIPSDGTFDLRLDMLVGPEYGEWSVAIDGRELGTVNGYGDELAAKKGESLGKHALSAGRHTLVLKSEGKDIASKGFDGAFDALVGSL